MRKYKLLISAFLLLGLCTGIRLGLLFGWSSTTFPLTPKWRIDLGISTYERPTYQDDLVLFPANGLINSSWYGLDAKTGQLVWSQQVEKYNFLRCLTKDYLVVSGPESLLVLQPQSGKFIWTGDRAEAATCSNTLVFTVGARGFVQALELATGQYRWQGIQPHQTVSGLIYNSETDELIAGGSIVVDPYSGQQLRIFASKSGRPPYEHIRGPMYLLDQGQLIMGGTVLDAKSGNVIHVEERFGGFAAPTVTEDTIYIADSTESLGSAGIVALDRTTFTLRWKYQPQYSLLPGVPLLTLSPVAVMDGIGYAIFSDGSLRAFHLGTGQELGYWKPGAMDLFLWPACAVAPVPGCVRQTGIGMTTSNDTLFVSFGDGKLYAFGRE